MLGSLKHKMTRNHLNGFIEKQKSNLFALDLGCANSPYSSYFSNRVGMDITVGKGVDIVGDAHKLPLKDKQVDIILCTEVIEHLTNTQIAISEMKRVLKPRGKLILTTRFIFPLHETPDDYWRFTKYGLKELFKDWEILELREEANTMETIGILLQRIAFQCDLYKKGTNFFVLLLAKIFSKLSFLIKKEYGAYRRTKKLQRKYKESNILSSGYYLICQK